MTVISCLAAVSLGETFFFFLPVNKVAIFLLCPVNGLLILLNNLYSISQGQIQYINSLTGLDIITIDNLKIHCGLNIRLFFVNKCFRVDSWQEICTDWYEEGRPGLITFESKSNGVIAIYLYNLYRLE